MAIKAFPCMQAEKALLLPDAQYFDFLLESIRNAQYRIISCMFIISVTGASNPTPVKEIIDELAYASWRGVDVRTLIGRTETLTIKLANDISKRYGNQIQLPIKYYVDRFSRSTHSKYVVIDDDLVMVGSHNWTTNALSTNREDTVAIRSAGVAKMLAREFDDCWQLAGGASDDQ